MCIYLLKKNKSYTFNMNMYRLLYFSYSLIKPQKYLGPDEFCFCFCLIGSRPLKKDEKSLQ